MQGNVLRTPSLQLFERNDGLPFDRHLPNRTDHVKNDLGDADGGAHVKVAPDQPDQGDGQRLRNIFGEKKIAGETWKRYVYSDPTKEDIEIDLTTRRRRVCFEICEQGALGVMAGLIGGAIISATASDSEKESATYLGVGSAIGMIAGIGIGRYFALGRKKIENMPYGDLAIGNNKGIRNAPRLDRGFKSKLISMLNKVPRSQKNDKAVRDLITILHEEDPSDATAELIDKLRIIIDDYQENCHAHGEAFLARAKGPITSWKLNRGNATTKQVLAKGIKAARIDQIDRRQFNLHDQPASVYNYLAARKSANLSGELNASEKPETVNFLASYEPWISHVERRAPKYELQRALLCDLVRELEDKRPELQGVKHLNVYNFLQEAYKGKLLLRWYAEECLEDETFLESVSDEWMKEKVMSTFHCVDLPMDRISEIFDEVCRHRDYGILEKRESENPAFPKIEEINGAADAKPEKSQAENV